MEVSRNKRESKEISQEKLTEEKALSKDSMAMIVFKCEEQSDFQLFIVKFIWNGICLTAVANSWLDKYIGQ